MVNFNIDSSTCSFDSNPEFYAYLLFIDKKWGFLHARFKIEKDLSRK